MNVKAGAWHYRMITCLWEGYCPKSLCGYFWIVVSTLLVYAILGVATLVVSPLLLITFGFSFGRRWMYRKYKLKWAFKEPKDPSLVWAWLSAKKRRVCPLIKIV